MQLCLYRFCSSYGVVPLIGLQLFCHSLAKHENEHQDVITKLHSEFVWLHVYLNEKYLSIHIRKEYAQFDFI